MEHFILTVDLSILLSLVCENVGTYFFQVIEKKYKYIDTHTMFSESTKFLFEIDFYV